MIDRRPDADVYAEALALVCGFYSALDDRDTASVVACFTDDGVWHRPDGARSGADEIASVVTNRPKDHVTAHCVSNLRLQADAKSYKAKYYLTVFGSSSDTAPRIVSLLDCEDELVEVVDVGLQVASKRTTSRMNFAV